MTTLGNNAAGGTNGTPVTALVGGNSGGASGNFWDLLGTDAPVFTSGSLPTGGPSPMMYLSTTTSSATSFAGWQASLPGTDTNEFSSFAFEVPSSNPTGSTLQIRRWLGPSGALIGAYGINTSGKLVTINSAGVVSTAASSIVAAYGGSYVRCDADLVTSATVGGISAQIAPSAIFGASYDGTVSAVDGFTQNYTGDVIKQSLFGICVAVASSSLEWGYARISSSTAFGPIVAGYTANWKTAGGIVPVFIRQKTS